jgi:tetratricopeptide (TPR) repeat protein
MDAAARNAALDAQARQHFNVGNSLFQAGRFSEAVREFQRAFELSQRPELQYNIYVSARDAGDVRTAAAALRSYLAAMPSAMPPGVPPRLQLEARLQSLEQQVAEQEAAERAREEERRAQEEELVRAEEARRRAEEERRRAEEQRRRAEAERRRIEAEAGVSIPGLIVGGVGIAALATGAITGLLALGETASLEDQCVQGRCPASARNTYDSARLLVTLTDLFLASGVVLTAAGVVMLWLGIARSGGGAGQRASVATPFATCHTRGCAALLTVRF